MFSLLNGMTQKKDPEDKGKTLEDKNFENLKAFSLGNLCYELILATLDYRDKILNSDSDHCSKEKYNQKTLESYSKERDRIIKEINRKEEEYSRKNIGVNFLLKKIY